MTNPASGGEYTPGSWLKQADSDLATAYLLVRERRFDWASYAAVQAAEKAIKAMLIAWGADLADNDKAKPWKMHEHLSLFHVFRKLPKAQELVEALTVLPEHDQNARYPDKKNDQPPCDSYQEHTATSVIENAKLVVSFAKQLVPAISDAVLDLKSVAASVTP
jgi:HEPN domain-containing protein